MTSDVRAVIAKEWRELFRYDGGKAGGWLRLALFAALGLILVRLAGPGFGTSWRTVLVVSFIACLVILPVVAATFAGEREQRTLETLLATRISDHALLLGKYAAVVSYGWAFAVGTTLIGLVVTGFQVRPLVIVGALLTSLLVAGLVTGVGLHVSLHAASVKDATQSLALVLIGITAGPALLAEVVPLETLLPPAWIAAARAWVPAEIGAGTLLVVAFQLLLLNGVLFGAALARFKRARLILD